MDLASIAPATKTVALGSAAVEVTGLSLRKITQLIVKYPELLALAAGKVELSNLIMSAPESALAIFALAVVGPSRHRWWQRQMTAALEATEDSMIRAFDEAATGQQLDALAIIVDLTFKGERGIPFLKSLIGSPRPNSMPNSEPEREPNADQNQTETPAESSPK